MTASTRRAALGAILAAPLTGGAVMALPCPSAELSKHEDQLLALGPQLVRLLDEYDRLWVPVTAAYAAWEQAGEHLPVPRWPAMEALPEWQAYLAVREPADKFGNVVEALMEPFLDVPLTTLPAIMLRHRYGMTFEAYREDAMGDLDRLWREGTLCA